MRSERKSKEQRIADYRYGKTLVGFLRGNEFRRSLGSATPILSFKRAFARWLNDPALQLYYLQGRQVDNELLALGYPIGPRWCKRGDYSPIYIGNLAGTDSTQLGLRELTIEDNVLLETDPTPEIMKVWKSARPLTTIPDSREPLRRADPNYVKAVAPSPSGADSRE